MPLPVHQRFPWDELNVNRSFLRGIRDDTDAGPIVTAILAIAQSLGLQVVIEGVETEAQVAFLRRHGCDTYQGHLFSPPVATDDVAALLARSRSHAPGGRLQEEPTHVG